MVYAIAIIGDLINSRHIENREQFQVHVQQSLDQLNEKYYQLILSKFTLTLGDEFQVVLRPNGEIFYLINDIQRYIGHPIRFGIGYGEIITKINPQMSLGADGPAYWNARQAIEKVKLQNWNGVSFEYFKGFLSEQDEVVNTLLLMNNAIRSDWTKAQEDVFNQLLENQIFTSDFNQNDIANQLDISASALSKRLKAGHIKIYMQSLKTLAHLMEEYYDK